MSPEHWELTAQPGKQWGHVTKTQEKDSDWISMHPVWFTLDEWVDGLGWIDGRWIDRRPADKCDNPPWYMGRAVALVSSCPRILHPPCRSDFLWSFSSSFLSLFLWSFSSSFLSLFWTLYPPQFLFSFLNSPFLLSFTLEMLNVTVYKDFSILTMSLSCNE